MSDVELPGEAFVLGVDARGLVRRECPSCHRTFKVRAGPSDATAVFRALARLLNHVNDSELGCMPPERHCPYCGEVAPEDGWLTVEQRAAVEKRADHWRRELRYHQLLQPQLTLSENPYVTYLAVPPDPYVAEPPEGEDALKPFPLICCNETLRIAGSWHGTVRCHICGTEHDAHPVLPGFLERMGSGGFDA